MQIDISTLKKKHKTKFFELILDTALSQIIGILGLNFENLTSFTQAEAEAHKFWNFYFTICLECLDHKFSTSTNMKKV